MALNPPPMSRTTLLLCVLAAAGVSLFAWDTLPLYPFRLLVTLMHESGHAVATKLVGGDVTSVTISPTQGGLTLSSYPDSLWRAMVVTSAGYVGSAIAGAVLLATAGRMRSGKLILYGLAVWMALVALLWVPLRPRDIGGAVAHASGFASSDGLFTLAFIAGTALALALVAHFGALGFRRMLIVFIATLSCLAALQDIRGLFGYGLTGSSSDADAMGRLTHLPAGLWAAIWMLMALLAVAVGLRSMLKQ
jgi:hypothetical protein